MKKKRFLKRVLLLDNYDSFTYNLKHYISSLGCHVVVVRNDEFDMDLSGYTHVVLSPGPGLPSDSKVLGEVLQLTRGKVPVLGVCLGMQAIGEFLGGGLFNQTNVKHGVSEIINVKKSTLFEGLKSQFEVGLYHSWAVNNCGDYSITATSSSGIIMAIENESTKMYGVQFHPESILTDYGMQILSNFLKL